MLNDTLHVLQQHGSRVKVRLHSSPFPNPNLSPTSNKWELQQRNRRNQTVQQLHTERLQLVFLVPKCLKAEVIKQSGKLCVLLASKFAFVFQVDE